MLATASYDQSAKVIDYKTGKVIHSQNTKDRSNLFKHFSSYKIYLSTTRCCQLGLFHLTILYDKERIEKEKKLKNKLYSS